MNAVKKNSAIRVRHSHASLTCVCMHIQVSASLRLTLPRSNRVWKKPCLTFAPHHPCIDNRIKHCSLQGCLARCSHQWTRRWMSAPSDTTLSGSICSKAASFTQTRCALLAHFKGLYHLQCWELQQRPHHACFIHVRQYYCTRSTFNVCELKYCHRVRVSTLMSAHSEVACV